MMKLTEMQKKWIMIIGVAVIVIAGGYLAIRALFPGDKEDTGPKYTTAEITRGNINVGVEATGSLNSGAGGSISVPMANDESGNRVTYSIREVFVKNGDVVKAGDPIMNLAAPSLDTQIDTLVEQLNAERKSLANLMNIPVEQVDDVNSEQGIVLTSPIDGRLNLTVKAGGKIEQGQLVAKVVDSEKLELTIPLTAYEIGLITDGKTKGLVNPSAGMGATIDAKIIDVNRNPVPVESKNLIIDSGVPSEETGVEFVYEVTIQINNPGLLQPGRNVSVGFYDPYPGYVFKDGEIPPNVNWCRYMAPIDKYVNEEDIFSTVEGVATKVMKKNNSLVKKGDALVLMAGQDVKENIEQKLESIRKKKIELSKYQSQKGSLMIAASSDGIIDGFDKKQGGSVQSGDYLGYIFSSSSMNMNVQVDDTDVLMVKVGGPVQVTVDALPGVNFEGKVEYIGGYGGEGGITRYDVYITVKGNDESGQVRPGMQAKAYIDAGSAENVLLAPMEAIFREDGVDKVEVLNADGSISVVAIEVGLMNSRQAEVKSGLTEGQLVITGSTSDVLPSQNGGGNSLLPGPGQDDNTGGDNTGGDVVAPDGGGTGGDMIDPGAGGNMAVPEAGAVDAVGVGLHTTQDIPSFWGHVL